MLNENHWRKLPLKLNGSDAEKYLFDNICKMIGLSNPAIISGTIDVRNMKNNKLHVQGREKCYNTVVLNYP